jgi:serine/threonine protein kinase
MDIKLWEYNFDLEKKALKKFRGVPHILQLLGTIKISDEDLVLVTELCDFTLDDEISEKNGECRNLSVAKI